MYFLGPLAGRAETERARVATVSEMIESNFIFNCFRISSVRKRVLYQVAAELAKTGSLDHRPLFPHWFPQFSIDMTACFSGQLTDIKNKSRCPGCFFHTPEGSQRL
jgi:hypothetical protein